jgi:glycosyltransferase involved in cell wall biosynthesis
MASDIGIFLKKKFGVKFIFDMRGWWADEKKESGEWTKWYYQPVYKYYKKREKIFFLNADQIISLTYSGCDEIMKNFSIDNKKIEVIPTCVDFEIFKPFSENKREEIRKELNILMHSVVLVYSGSLGGNYNVESLIQVFNNLCTQFENSFLLVLLKDDLVAKVEDQLQQNGIKNFKILSVPFKSVTNYLMAADIGLVFYDITFSVIGRSPTKLGEYWASGLPVIITSGIGDIDRLDKRYPMGIILNKEGKFDIKEKFQDFPVSNRAMLRDYARSYFGLEKGVELYAGVYNKLFKN